MLNKSLVASILAVVAALTALGAKLFSGGDLMPSMTELSLAVSTLLAAWGFQRN